VMVACTPHRPAVPAGTADGPAVRYVAVGASETVGVGADDPLRDAWTQVFYRTALPRASTFVNLGVAGSTVADALTAQVPAAVELQPDLVTVWLNVNDLIAGVSARDYETRLGEAVHRLRRGGATRVLVGNTPALDRLPAYVRCRANPGDPLCAGALGARRLPDPAAVRAAVDAYNAAITRVADREGAIVVDLHATEARAVAAGTDAALVSGDGFHPSTAGHRAVAAAFAAALANPPSGR
jgi:acyl-CoA thioesterase I